MIFKSNNYNFIVIFLSICIASNSPMRASKAFGQELKNDRDLGIEYEFNEQKDVIGIVFHGSAEWLVSQKDTKSHWHKYPKLKSVSIINTTITEQQLEYISKIQSVTSLSINSTAEEIEIPGSCLKALRKMRSLKFLDIVDDGFSVEEWGFLSDLYSLKGLSIRGLIQEELLRTILMNGNLQELSVNGVEFDKTVSDRKAFILPSNIKVLHLGYSNCPTEFVKSIAKCESIQDIELYSCRINNDDIKSLSHMPNLERLSLSVSSVSAIQQIATLSKLKFLRVELMSNEQLNDYSFLKAIPNLQFLSLLKISAYNSSFEPLRNLTGLQYLEIPSQEIDATNKDILKTMPNLEVLKSKNLHWNTMR